MTKPIEARGLLNFFFRAKYIVLLGVLSVTSTAVLASVLLPAVYDSTAIILVTLGREHLPNAPLQDQAFLKSPNPTEIIDREVAILRSEDVLSKVVDDIGIQRLYPALVTAQSKRSPRQDAIDSLKSELKIPTTSNVLSISFRHKDPKVAADVINRVIKFYQERRLEVLAKPPLDYARQHLQGATMQLHEAENALQAFQQKHHLFGMQDQLRLLLTQQTELDARQRHAEERARELRSRYASLDQDLRQVAGEKSRYAQLDKIITETREKVMSLQIEQQALLADYGPSHPKLISIRSQVNAAQRELREQQRFANGRKPIEDPVYQHLEKEKLTVQADLDGQVSSAAVLGEQSKLLARRIEELGALQMELLRLQRQQEAREGTYQAALRNHDEMRANADMNEKRIGGVSVIQNATVPTQPARPGPLYIIMGGIFGGTGLGVGLALVSQLLSQRLWQPHQVRERLGLPFLGSIGFLPRPARIEGMLPMLMPPGSQDGPKVLGPSQSPSR